MQKIPDPGFRVSTGPLKFGDDWCGYFYRGDELPKDGWRVVIALVDGAIPLELYEGIRARALCELAELDECQETPYGKI